MSAYGKVTYNSSDNSVTETVAEESHVESTMEKQLDKFDTSYNVEKLQELYAEYDNITIDEEKIRSITQVKANAISTNVPFRLILTISTMSIVALLLVVLSIYNIFVINGMTSSINYLQEEVISYEANLVQSESLYEELTNVESIKSELTEMGYKDIASSNIVTVTVPERAEVIELHGETNWFDSVCNFISRIFG